MRQSARPTAVSVTPAAFLLASVVTGVAETSTSVRALNRMMGDGSVSPSHCRLPSEAGMAARGRARWFAVAAS